MNFLNSTQGAERYGPASNGVNSVAYLAYVEAEALARDIVNNLGTSDFENNVSQEIKEALQAQGLIRGEGASEIMDDDVAKIIMSNDWMN